MPDWLNSAELGILDGIQTLLRNSVFDLLMPLISFLGNGGWIWIATALILLCMKKHRKNGILVLIGLLLGLLICNVALKLSVARPRPCWLNESYPLLIGVPSDYSFPSGHTVSSTIAATILTLRERRFGWISIPVAVSIAFSRLYLYVHFPTDVLFGALLGVWIGVFVSRIADRVLLHAKGKGTKHMKKICKQSFDAERALYGSEGVRLENCRFEGEADGESALKESRDVTAVDCHFALRYPLWHDTDLTMERCTMTETCRAALWYDENVTVKNSVLGGIKAFRECRQVCLQDCEVNSAEFGWRCHDISFANCKLTSEYFLFGSSDVRMENTEFHGKYSFQYVQNATVRNSKLYTKDAFWHSENVTVYDSVVAGEYLGWYSKHLRLVRCTITGTQPLCYCEDLVLEDCTMEGCDLAFENCTVQASVRGEIVSVKNPIHGRITADSIGEIILDEHRRPGSDCLIEVKAAQGGKR